MQLKVDIGTHLISKSQEPAPGSMGKTFDSLHNLGMIDAALSTRLKKAVGFRNIGIHNYEAINWEIVFSIVTEHIDDFKDFARDVESQI